MRNLDPRTKMMLVFCLSSASLMAENLVEMCALLGVTCVCLFMVGVGVSRQKRQILSIVKIIIFLVIIQLLAGQGLLGVQLGVRMCILVLSALILFTGESRDYLLALVQMRMPFELAYMIILTMQFFPCLREEAQDVYYSVQLRGVDLKKASLGEKIHLYKKMCIPILSGALARAKDTSIAMEARGFCSSKNRTYMRRLTMKRIDWILVFLLPVLTIGFVWKI